MTGFAPFPLADEPSRWKRSRCDRMASQCNADFRVGASRRLENQRYNVEPYVMSADVYTEPPHVGRGGWTWYTGSAGWMYQAGMESILGFRLRGSTLVLDPCIPRSWAGYEIDYQYHSTKYEIVVENPRAVNRGVALVELDGHALTTGEAGIPLTDDGMLHKVRVFLG